MDLRHSRPFGAGCSAVIDGDVDVSVIRHTSFVHRLLPAPYTSFAFCPAGSVYTKNTTGYFFADQNLLALPSSHPFQHLLLFLL
jgi:hypothetical protein